MEQELTQRIKATDQIKQELWNYDLRQWKINHCYHVATRLVGLENRRGHLLFHAFLDPVNLRWTLTGNTPVLYATKHEACHKAQEWRNEE